MVECIYNFNGMIKHHGLLYLVRFLFGIGEAPMYPSNAVFNSTWFAKDEKGRASSALLEDHISVQY